MTNVLDVRADIDAEIEGQTVATRFVDVVRRLPDEVALRQRADDGSWTELTWQQYADAACRLAGGLRALGVGKGDRVGLLLRNIVEFHIADVATLLVGATPFSIYSSSARDQVQHLLSHAEAKVVIVEDAGFLEPVAEV